MAASSDAAAAHGTEKPLEGLPRHVKVPGLGQIEVGPNPVIRQAARDYMAHAGLPYHPPTQYVKVDPERAKRIADEFDKMKDAPHDPQVKAAYDAMIHETLAQYQAVKAAGLKVEFIDYAKHGDPYAASPRLATEDIKNNNHFWVFSTRDGFGSSEFDPSRNPLLAETGEKDVNGKPMLANDVFRVVHDYFGHAKEGNGFRASGEENAWRSHVAMFSPLAAQAMTSETRGQNSWVNYGPYGETNRTASGAATHYADQKVGLMPAWTATEGAHDAPLAKYSPDQPRDARGRWGEGDGAASPTKVAPTKVVERAVLIDKKLPPETVKDIENRLARIPDAPLQEVVHDDYRAAFSKAELGAFSVYTKTMDASGNINGVLRGLVDPADQPMAVAKIKLMDKAIERSETVTTEDMKVYRAFVLPDKAMAALTSSGTRELYLNDKGFMSTTELPKVAKSFYDREQSVGDRPVFAKILVPSGMHVLDTAKAGVGNLMARKLGYPVREMVLPHGGSLRVIHYDPVGRNVTAVYNPSLMVKSVRTLIEADRETAVRLLPEQFISAPDVLIVSDPTDPDDLEKFSPDQPRGPDGKWVESGAASGTLSHHTTQLSWESSPGRSTHSLPEIHGASLAQRQEFHSAISRAITDEKGRDLIAERLGLQATRTISGPGVFEGHVNPGSQGLVYARQAKDSLGLTQDSRDRLNVAEAVRGALLRQDAAAWHSVTAAGASVPSHEANLVDVNIGRPLTNDEAIHVNSALSEHMGSSDFSPITTATGFRLLNTPDFTGVDNATFQVKVAAALQDHRVPDYTATRAKAESNYIANDWKEQPRGQGYMEAIRSVGRPDLSNRANRIIAALGPRISTIEDTYAAKYGWTVDKSSRFWEHGQVFTGSAA